MPIPGRLITVLGAALLTLFLCLPIHAQKPGLVTTEITTITPDSLTIHAWITYAPQRAKAPMIVCLPMMGHDHASYDYLVQNIVESSLLAKTDVPYILTVDLRGHGLSTQKGKRTLSPRELSDDEFANFPSDVAAIIHASIHDTTYHIDTTDIRIIGASIGANTAPWVTQGVAGITKIVLLSPGDDFRGIKPAEALKTYKGQTLLVASENDEYSFQAVGNLSKAAPTAKMQTYPGNAHGTEIINSRPMAMKAIVSFLISK